MLHTIDPCREVPYSVLLIFAARHLDTIESSIKEHRLPEKNLKRA
jgi:hypothetical protein